MARGTGTGTGTVYTSPKKAARLAKRKRAEEAAWKARNGPVVVRYVEPSPSAEQASADPPEQP